MAMLSEPRQRKRYNLVPKGKALFEDSDRFGTKMLEKMGWSKGKGLGANEDGEKEFVRIRYKNDANGLGFEERDDQWTEHEKHFNGLLENLKSQDSSSSPRLSDNCEVASPAVGLGFVSATKGKLKDKFSGQSLEEKSKNSKARVHYKKFTKGKDISQYSEKDLANIFGKKATPESTNIYDQFKAYNAGIEKETTVDELKNNSFELGTQTINTGVSVSDYFKMKMAALNAKKGEQITENGSSEMKSTGTENDNKTSAQKNGSKKKAEAEDLVPDSEEIVKEIARKQKKSKKKNKTEIPIKEDGSGSEFVVEDVVPVADEDLTEQVKVLNGETRKKHSETVVEAGVQPKVPLEEKSNSFTVEKSSKMKKNKKLAAREYIVSLNSETLNEANELNSKTKKRAAKENGLNDDQCSPSQIKKKKAKKTPSKPTQQNLPIKSAGNNEFTENKASNCSQPFACPEQEQKNKLSASVDHSKNIYLTDTYKISTFCAEKFRTAELHQYNGSSIVEINGYGLSDNLELKIVEIPTDKERILKLWNCIMDKYQYADPKRKIYYAYRNKARKARKANYRIPKIKTKCLKRRQVFQSL